MSLNRNEETQRLLDAPDLADGPHLEEILVDGAPISPVVNHVKIAGVPVSFEALLLIASHLSLHDYLALSAVNHALHHSLSSQRITNSLYIRIPALDEPVTLFQAKLFLTEKFPERDKWNRLKKSEIACQTLDTCCNSFGCEITSIFMLTLSAMGGMAATGLPLIVYMVAAEYSTNVIVGSAFAASVSSGIAAGFATHGIYAGSKRIVTHKIQSISTRVDELDRQIANDPELRRKDIVIKFFKSVDRRNQDIGFYHDSNKSIDYRPTRRMMDEC